LIPLALVALVLWTQITLTFGINAGRRCSVARIWPRAVRSGANFPVPALLLWRFCFSLSLIVLIALVRILLALITLVAWNLVALIFLVLALVVLAFISLVLIPLGLIPCILIVLALAPLIRLTLVALVLLTLALVALIDLIPLVALVLAVLDGLTLVALVIRVSLTLTLTLVALALVLSPQALTLAGLLSLAGLRPVAIRSRSLFTVPALFPLVAAPLAFSLRAARQSNLHGA
jgi:hypothetical protein